MLGLHMPAGVRSPQFRSGERVPLIRMTLEQARAALGEPERRREKKLSAA
jgi:hypothetical protein